MWHNLEAGASSHPTQNCYNPAHSTGKQTSQCNLLCCLSITKLDVAPAITAGPLRRTPQTKPTGGSAF